MLGGSGQQLSSFAAAACRIAPKWSWSTDPGSSSHGRAHIAACLQNPPTATCALACFAALSSRLWYALQAYYPTGILFFSQTEVSSELSQKQLSQKKKKKKKSILFISPDFLEMGSRLVLARISAMLCKQRYFARSCMCLLISSLKPVFWCQ